MNWENVYNMLMSQSFRDWYDNRFMAHAMGEEEAPSKEEILKSLKALLKEEILKSLRDLLTR